MLAIIIPILTSTLTRNFHRSTALANLRGTANLNYILIHRVQRPIHQTTPSLKLISQVGELALRSDLKISTLFQRPQAPELMNRSQHLQAPSLAWDQSMKKFHLPSLALAPMSLNIRLMRALKLYLLTRKIRLSNNSFFRPGHQKRIMTKPLNDNPGPG